MATDNDQSSTSGTFQNGNDGFDTTPPPQTRPRSGSLSQLSSITETAFNGLSIRRGSLSRLFTGSHQYHFDKEHNYLGQALSDSIDDLDTFSQISDSGFSDASHNTQTSVDALGANNCTLKKNASMNNLIGEDSVAAKDEPAALKRNSSSGDLTLDTAANINDRAMANIPDRAMLKERAQQKRLSHSMVWNWVKSHQVRIDENATLDSSTKDMGKDEKFFNKNKNIVTMRDLNAIGPSGW